MCENLSENEAKFLILEQTHFLRILNRKYWFSVNVPSQNSHNYSTQQPKTMKLCQNVPHMYIFKANKFQVWKNISKPQLENFGPKMGELGKIWGFSPWGVQKWKFSRMCQICISWNPTNSNKFQVWTNISKFQSGNILPKIRKYGENLIYSTWGVNI